MLKVFVLCAIVASAVARPQHFQFPLTFAAAPQPFQQIQQQQQQQQQQAQPQQQQLAIAPAAPPVPLTNPSQVISGAAPDGSAIFGYQTLDGQSRSESVGIDGSVRGSYSYIDANGQTVKINYIADQGGFRTSADPIPVANPGSQAAPAAALQVQQQAAAPQPQQPQLQFFQQQPQQQHAVAAPVPAAPTQPQSFTPFFSPLPASTLPLSHFGFQQLQAAPAPAPVSAPAPAPAPAPQPARHLTPITYSFTTTG